MLIELNAALIKFQKYYEKIKNFIDFLYKMIILLNLCKKITIFSNENQKNKANEIF